MNTYLRFEWWNECDLHGTLYSGGLRNWLYLDADLARPAYNIEQSGVEGIDGVFTPDLQRWTKRVAVDFIAPDYLVDALNYGVLCDNFYVYDKFGSYIKCENISIELDWQDCFAVVTLSFDVKAIARTTKNTNITIGSDV